MRIVPIDPARMPCSSKYTMRYMLPSNPPPVTMTVLRSGPTSSMRARSPSSHEVRQNPMSREPQRTKYMRPFIATESSSKHSFDVSNGLEYSPNLRTLYVTNTGRTADMTRPATIYAFDLTADLKGLTNRPTFAYADNGFPDGIYTDIMGHVWSVCGDGVQV